jgi:hypothetical protein
MMLMKPSKLSPDNVRIRSCRHSPVPGKTKFYLVPTDARADLTSLPQPVRKQDELDEGNRSPELQ